MYLYFFDLIYTKQEIHGVKKNIVHIEDFLILTDKSLYEVIDVQIFLRGACVAQR